MSGFALAWGVGGLLLAMALEGPAAQSRAVAELDHVPLAVRDLGQASADWRAMGFTLKAGRHHANGIRNAHVKFPDGSGIELITAGDAVDRLTARYLAFLARGNGPAFVALRAPDTARLTAALERAGCSFARDGDVIEFRHPRLEYLFAVRGNRSPTDRPEHCDHANGTTGLRAVWIAAPDGERLERVLAQLGGTVARRTVAAPDPVAAAVVALGAGEVVIVPASSQLTAGRPIVGASFTVRDIDVLARQLSAARVAARVEQAGSRRVLVPPDAAHGLWLEFRE